MKNYSKKELQSMSDWQLVQIYCDELGGIDENDLMIEVRGNKQERENLISHLLQMMKPKYAKGSTIKGESNFGKEGSGFDNPKYKDMYKGTYDNRGLALKPTNDITTLGSKLVIEYDKIYNRFYWKLMKQNGTEHSRGVNFKTRQEAIDDYMTTKFAKGSTVDGGDVGDTIADRYARLTKTEGKRLDELSKKVRINEQTDAEDVEWDKLVHKYRGWEYKHAKGGGIDINELNMPVIRTQFEDEEYEFKDGGGVGNIKERVIDYYINNSDNEDLINLMGVSDVPNLKQVAEKWVNNRDSYYDKIFSAIDGIHNRTWAENKFEELGLEKYKDGGEVGENKDVLKVAKAIFDNNNKKGKIKTSFGDKTLVGLKAMIENTNYDSEEIASSIFSVNEKKGKISTSFGDKYYGGLLAMINHSRANKLKNYNLGQMAEGGATKGFCYTIGGL
jgi:hypothetical protein